MKKIIVLLILLVFILIIPFYAQTLTIDDADSGCTTKGVWADNKSNGFGAGGTVNGKYLYTSRYAPFKKTGNEQVIWTPNITKAGNYKVEVSFRGTANRSSKVGYEVKYDGGTKKMTVSQRSNGMTWEKLGEFPFK
ncbi:hypothetical protein KAJ27_19645, partial [bacterium]|nr:hypothetical protein [bacterium]